MRPHLLSTGGATFDCACVITTFFVCQADTAIDVMAKCTQDQPDKWEQPCSEKSLCAISRKIADWQDIAPFLGLSEVDEAEIVGSPPRPVRAQKIYMLRKWKQYLGAKATYKELVKAFQGCGRQDLVDCVNELLLSEGSHSLSGMFVCFVCLFVCLFVCFWTSFSVALL